MDRSTQIALDTLSEVKGLAWALDRLTASQNDHAPDSDGRRNDDHAVRVLVGVILEKIEAV